MTGLLIKRTALALALILIGWVGLISWQQFERHARIQAEVAALEAEAQKIREENETFSERIGYFSTDAFREQEAKKKLGLKKRSENVVVIKPVAGATENPEAKEAVEAQSSGNPEISNLPNYRKWQEVFFGER